MKNILKSLKIDIEKLYNEHVLSYFDQWLLSQNSSADRIRFISPATCQNISFSKDFKQNPTVREGFWTYCSRFSGMMLDEYWLQVGKLREAYEVGGCEFIREAKIIGSQCVTKIINEAHEVDWQLTKNDVYAKYDRESHHYFMSEIILKLLKNHNAMKASIALEGEKNYKPLKHIDFERDELDEHQYNLIKDMMLSYDSPVTLAIWSDEYDRFFYLSKDQLVSLFQEGELVVNIGFLDINCTMSMKLSDDTKAGAEGLVITDIANKRLIAIDAINQGIETGLTCVGFPLNKLKMLFAKQTWEPMEAACIIVGIDPTPHIGSQPEINREHELEVSQERLTEFIISKVKQGYYDFLENNMISEHGFIHGGRAIFSLRLGHLGWQLYNVIRTYSDLSPLAILENVLKPPFTEPDKIQFNEHYKNIALCIKQISPRISNFDTSYPLLTQYLHRYDTLLLDCGSMAGINNDEPKASDEDKSLKELLVSHLRSQINGNLTTGKVRKMINDSAQDNGYYLSGEMAFPALKFIPKKGTNAAEGGCIEVWEYDCDKDMPGKLKERVPANTMRRYYQP